MLAIPTLVHAALVDPPRPGADPGAISSSADPVVLARRWESLGFRRLHLRELGGADGLQQTSDLLRELVRQACLPVQLESLAADDVEVESSLELGVNLIVGSARGLSDPGWLEALASRSPGQISLGLDLRGNRLLPRGGEPRRELFDLIDELASLPLASIVLTTAASVSRLQPADLSRLEEIVSRAAWPVVAVGASVSLVELRNLEERGVSAAVLPAVWDHEALDPRMVAEEFAADR